MSALAARAARCSSSGPDAFSASSSVRKGQAVTQGQRVGAVGATGWATGPHLHFEFRVNGRHQDPLTVARRSEGQPLTAQSRPAFDRVAGAARLKLDAAASVATVARVE